MELVILYTLVSLIVCQGFYMSARVVQTKNGALRGLIVKPNNRELGQVEVFLGVPYASAPVGSFRFMPPMAPVKWEGVKKADTMPPVCPQKLPDVSNRREALKMMPSGRYNYLQRLLPMLRNQSEDCLYLNIYTPVRDKYSDLSAKLPVLVYIHGESYEWNSGNPYDGTVLASYGQVLVVTINFRLGILGFLRPTLSEKQVSNFGLLDQIAALLWIRGNIAEFGGDPDNVSLFGHGTGAALANFLLVSPVAQTSKGLFKRAILMSGSALSTWAISWEPYAYTIEVARALKCPLVSGSDEFVNCLRSKSVEELLAVSLPHPPFTTALGPILDDTVIRQQSMSQMKIDLDIFSKYDLLFGVTSAESFNMLNAREVKFGMSEERKKRLLRTYIANTFDHQTDMIYVTVANEYKSWNPTTQFPGKRKEIEIRDEILEILSDAQIVAPVVKMGDIHSELNSKSYFYVFNHQSVYGDYPFNQGTVHGEELPYVFGAPLVGGFSHFGLNYTHEEKFLSELVMTMWTNFAKTGNPNLPTPQAFKTPGANFNWLENLKRLWPAYDRVSQHYLHIDMQVVTKLHYRPKKLGVWNDYIPQIIHSSEIPLVMPPKQSVINFTPTAAPYNFPFTPAPPKSKYEPVPVDIVPVEPYAPKYQPSIIPSDKDLDSASDSQITPPAQVGTPMSAIILIGICILLFNCIAMAGIYYRRDRKRKKAKSNRSSVSTSNAGSLNAEEGTATPKRRPGKSKQSVSMTSLNSKESKDSVAVSGTSSNNGTLRKKPSTGSQSKISAYSVNTDMKNGKSPYNHRRYKSENSLYNDGSIHSNQDIKYKKGQSVKFYNSGSLPSKSVTKSSSSIASMRSTTSRTSAKSATSRSSVKSNSSVKPLKKNASCQSLPTQEYSWGITPEMTMYQGDDEPVEDVKPKNTNYPVGTPQNNGTTFKGMPIPCPIAPHANATQMKSGIIVHKYKPYPPMRSTSLTAQEIESLEKMNAFLPMTSSLRRNISTDSRQFDNIEHFYGTGSGEAPVSPSAIKCEGPCLSGSSVMTPRDIRNSSGFDYPTLFNLPQYPSKSHTRLAGGTFAPSLPAKKMNVECNASSLPIQYPRSDFNVNEPPKSQIATSPITPSTAAVVSAAAHTALATATAPAFVGSLDLHNVKPINEQPIIFGKTPPAIVYDIEGVRKNAIVSSAKAKAPPPPELSGMEKPLKSVLKQTSAYDKPRTNVAEYNFGSVTNVTGSAVPSGSSSPSSACSPEDVPENKNEGAVKKKKKSQKKGKS